MQDPFGRPVPSLADVLLYLAGVAGLAAAITLLFLGMRAVMDVGGMCAEGGPYVVETTCPEGSAAATLLGVFGGLASLFLAIWKGSAIGGTAVTALFLAWPALFGALGFNFLQYGFDPPGDDPGWAWGWLVCGVVFWAMAFGPLLFSIREARGALMGGIAARPSGRARSSREPSTSPLAPIGPAGHGLDEPGDAGDAALVDGLERLAALHRAGSLTDDEFARAKAELLDHAGA